VRAGQDQFLGTLIALLRQDFPSLSDEKLENRARLTLFALTHSFVFAMVKQIARAVGSPDLEATYANVLKAMPTPAVSVVDAAIGLEQVRLDADALARLYKDLDGKPFARLILQYLVVEHLYLFPVERRVRESLCKRLDIPIKQTRLLNPEQKRLQA
jgi:hypothetical protein